MCDSARAEANQSKQKWSSEQDLSSQHRAYLLAKSQLPALPWGLSGKESACQCRRHGLEPWSGRIPHAMGQISPWATTTEPVL